MTSIFVTYASYLSKIKITNSPLIELDVLGGYANLIETFYEPGVNDEHSGGLGGSRC